MSKHDKAAASAQAQAASLPAARAGSDPSNTDPATDNYPPPLVLRKGIDSLLVSVPGAISGEWDSHLCELKELAQSPDPSTRSLALVELFGLRFELKGTGSHHYKFVLLNNAYRIQLAGRNAKRLPLAYVQVSSDWLTQHGPRAALDQLLGLLRELGQVEGEAKVSRADLFVDFTAALRLNDWNEPAWICRARKISRHTEGEVCSGWTVGMGGDVGCRLYDKTLEIQKSGKDYLKALWHQAGWNPPSPVYRLEFELKREALKAHGVDSLDELLGKLGGLWAYATQSWLRLALPGPDENQSRWPIHPVWQVLSAIDWDGIPGASVPVRPDRAPSDERLYQSVMSVLSSYMAVRALDDPGEAFTRCLQETRSHYNGRGFLSDLTFDDQAQAKAAEKARLFNLPFPGVDERIKTRRKQSGAAAYRKATGRGS
ncbi:MAG: replication initiation factor [Nevskiales bacterium]